MSDFYSICVFKFKLSKVMTLTWRHITEYLYCSEDWWIEVLLLE